MNTIDQKSDNSIKYIIDYNVFTGLFYAYLLGGEFSNCYGQGSTELFAIASLKIRVYQLRNKNKQ
jgi:hypothetical protein